MKFFIDLVPPVQFSEKVTVFQKRHKENKLPAIVEPHITLKMQDKLTEDLEWLPSVRETIASFYPFKVRISGPDTFGKSVLYLRIESEMILQLHKALVKLFNPSKEEIKENFELDYFTPHLTLAIVDETLTEELLDQLRLEAEDKFTESFEFNAMFVRVSRENPDGSYSPYEDIPLGHRS